ncbi:MAG: hypothetical protein HYS22_06445 [Deltaproteobacteria bacterium]|nr:hypothetical protein [Deltaproteobacteria bacterium]
MVTIRTTDPKPAPVYQESGVSLISGKPVAVTADRNPDEIRARYATDLTRLEGIRAGHSSRRSNPGDIGNPKV